MADPTTLWEILNSEFVKSLSGSAVGAFAGAGAGAWAAQHIAERSKVREEALKELRNINAANTLVFSLSNAYINLKVQHIKELWETFQRDKAAAEQARETQTEIHLAVDLRNLDPPPGSVAEIKRIVLDHTTPPTRALALLDALDRTILQLNAFLVKRNALINDIKAGSKISPSRYYGLPHSGIVDQTFGSTLEAIASHTDECIYFSTNLAAELSEHGEALKAKLPKRMELHVVTADFSNAAQHIPPAENFRGWNKENFKKQKRPLPPGLNFWRSIPPYA